MTNLSTHYSRLKNLYKDAVYELSQATGKTMDEIREEHLELFPPRENDRKGYSFNIGNMKKSYQYALRQLEEM